MTLSAHLTTDWPLEKLQPYFADITKAMLKLEKRYPNDITTPFLANEVMSGRRQLWLVLDGETFVSFALTEIRTLEATGRKVVCVTDLAGEGGERNCPMAKAVEDWAIEVGADEVAIIGRPGWRKALAKEGYGAEIMTYRKFLKEMPEAAPCVSEAA